MLKIIGWTLLILLILLIVLLHFSLTINVHAGRDGFVLKAKYLFLTLYPRRKKAEPEEETGDEDFDDALSDEALMNGLSAEQEQALIEQANAGGSPDKPDKPDKPQTSAESKKEDNKPSADGKKDKKSEKKESEKEDSSTSDGGSEEDGEEEQKPKKSLREKIAGLRQKYEKFKPYIPVTWKYFLKLLKAVRIQVDDLWVDVGRDDAHEAAIFYGSIQAAVSSLMAMCADWFTLRVKRWDVNCRFAENVIDGGTDISVRVRPSTLIAIAVCFGVNFLIIRFRRKRAAKKAAQINTADAGKTA